MNRFDYRKIRQMLLFAAVVEEGSFRRAADRLNMSQPPLTAQIDELESRLKVKLLVRTPRGVRMTAQGQAFLPLVRNFIAQAELLDYSIEELRLGHKALLTVAAVSEAMMSWIPEFRRTLEAKAPGLALFTKEIDSIEVVRELETNNVMLAIGFFEKFENPNLRFATIREEKPVLVVSADHPLAKVNKVNLKDLADEDWVFQVRNISPYLVDALIGACLEKGFSPRIRHEVTGTMREIAFVGCGQGIGMLPEFFACMLPPSVVAKPIADVTPFIRLSIAWNASVESAPRDEALRLAGVLK
ncbi:MAG: LysR family transcriptional regulator [Sutterellaceae bacterium]|nr:LysR family transcriptional regulator [Sutterellaceae bacterium]